MDIVDVYHVKADIELARHSPNPDVKGDVLQWLNVDTGAACIYIRRGDRLFCYEPVGDDLFVRHIEDGWYKKYAEYKRSKRIPYSA